MSLATKGREAVLEVDATGVQLLVEDPDLAAGLGPEQREQAERLVVVPSYDATAGAWDIDAMTREPNLGVLILDGFVTVNVTLAERVASQLAGPGDVLHGTDDQAVLPALVSHHVNDHARVAVLDRRFIAAVRRWPELLVALHQRLRTQEQRLATHAAIGKMRRVEDRVLAVLWQLGERWGRRARDGIVVPLALTHETIGRLAGAERPTVSLALGELDKRGEVTRRDDGSFVLEPTSWERLIPTGGRSAQLRALPVAPTPSAKEAPAVARTPASNPDYALLRRRVAALQELLPESRQRVDEILATARAVAERSRMTRERIGGERAARRSR